MLIVSLMSAIAFLTLVMFITIMCILNDNNEELSSKYGKLVNVKIKYKSWQRYVIICCFPTILLLFSILVVVGK